MDAIASKYVERLRNCRTMDDFTAIIHELAKDKELSPAQYGKVSMMAWGAWQRAASR